MIHVGSSKSVSRTQFVDMVAVGAVLLDTIMVVDDAVTIGADVVGAVLLDTIMVVDDAVTIGADVVCEAAVVDDNAEGPTSAVNAEPPPQAEAIRSSAATRSRGSMGWVWPVPHADTESGDVIVRRGPPAPRAPQRTWLL